MNIFKKGLSLLKDKKSDAKKLGGAFSEIAENVGKEGYETPQELASMLQTDSVIKKYYKKNQKPSKQFSIAGLFITAFINELDNIKFKNKKISDESYKDLCKMFLVKPGASGKVSCTNMAKEFEKVDSGKLDNILGSKNKDGVSKYLKHIGDLYKGEKSKDSDTDNVGTKLDGRVTSVRSVLTYKEACVGIANLLEAIHAEWILPSGEDNQKLPDQKSVVQGSKDGPEPKVELRTEQNLVESKNGTKTEPEAGEKGDLRDDDWVKVEKPAVQKSEAKTGLKDEQETESGTKPGDKPKVEQESTDKGPEQKSEVKTVELKVESKVEPKSGEGNSPKAAKKPTESEPVSNSEGKNSVSAQPAQRTGQKSEVKVVESEPEAELKKGSESKTAAQNPTESNSEPNSEKKHAAKIPTSKTTQRKLPVNLNLGSPLEASKVLRGHYKDIKIPQYVKNNPKYVRVLEHSKKLCNYFLGILPNILPDFDNNEELKNQLESINKAIIGALDTLNNVSGKAFEWKEKNIPIAYKNIADIKKLDISKTDNANTKTIVENVNAALHKFKQILEADELYVLKCLKEIRKEQQEKAEREQQKKAEAELLKKVEDERLKKVEEERLKEVQKLNKRASDIIKQFNKMDKDAAEKMERDRPKKVRKDGMAILCGIQDAMNECNNMGQIKKYGYTSVIDRDKKWCQKFSEKILEPLVNLKANENFSKEYKNFCAKIDAFNLNAAAIKTFYNNDKLKLSGDSKKNILTEDGKSFSDSVKKCYDEVAKIKGMDVVGLSENEKDLAKKLNTALSSVQTLLENDFNSIKQDNVKVGNDSSNSNSSKGIEQISKDAAAKAKEMEDTREKTRTISNWYKKNGGNLSVTIKYASYPEDSKGKSSENGKKDYWFFTDGGIIIKELSKDVDTLIGETLRAKLFEQIGKKLNVEKGCGVVEEDDYIKNKYIQWFPREVRSGNMDETSGTWFTTSIKDSKNKYGFTVKYNDKDLTFSIKELKFEGPTLVVKQQAAKRVNLNTFVKSDTSSAPRAASAASPESGTPSASNAQSATSPKPVKDAAPSAPNTASAIPPKPVKNDAPSASGAQSATSPKPGVKDATPSAASATSSSTPSPSISQKKVAEKSEPKSLSPLEKIKKWHGGVTKDSAKEIKATIKCTKYRSISYWGQEYYCFYPKDITFLDLIESEIKGLIGKDLQDGVFNLIKGVITESEEKNKVRSEKNKKDAGIYYHNKGYIWWWVSGKSMDSMAQSLSAKLQDKSFEINYEGTPFKFKIPKGGIELNA